LTASPCDVAVTCGISIPLGMLSPTRRQVSYALLTRSPLYSGYCYPFRVRLACLIHAANVRSEPGSNSPLCLIFHTKHGVREPPRHRGINKRSLSPKTEKDPSGLHDTCVHYSFVKEQDAQTCASLAFLGRTVNLRRFRTACQCENYVFFRVRTIAAFAAVGPSSRPAGLKVKPCRPQRDTIA
jgi:hypothetical protein